MTRYQVLRSLGCDPLSAGIVASINWLFGVREGVVGFMNVVIEYDPSLVYDKKTKFILEDVK